MGLETVCLHCGGIFTIGDWASPVGPARGEGWVHLRCKASYRPQFGTWNDRVDDSEARANFRAEDMP